MQTWTIYGSKTIFIPILITNDLRLKVPVFIIKFRLDCDGFNPVKKYFLFK